jgi:hypothetical protein
VLTRIQQRLIGRFDYTDIARSFDGAMARYGSETWNFTAMYGVPTKGAFDLDGMYEISHMDERGNSVCARWRMPPIRLSNLRVPVCRQNLLDKLAMELREDLVHLS